MRAKIASGVKKYVMDTHQAGKDAQARVSNQQKSMVAAVKSHSASRAPMGAKEYSARVRNEYKNIKKERGISLIGSLKKSFNK